MRDLERMLREDPGGMPPVDGLLRRAAGDGLLDVVYAHVDSPLGTLLVAGTAKGIVRIAYPDRSLDAVLGELAEKVSPRILEAPEQLDDARRQLEAYFDGRRRDFDLSVDWALERGFMERVLRATARIPPGSVATYSEIAAAAGSPRGARAAGNALGANRIPIVVPCHRVVHKGGGIGGYTGGLDRKRLLLRLEGWLRE